MFFVENRVLQGALRELGYSNDSTGSEKVKGFVNTIFNETSQDVCRLDRNSVVLKVSDSLSKDLEGISTMSLFNGKTECYLVEIAKVVGRWKLRNCPLVREIMQY